MYVLLLIPLVVVLAHWVVRLNVANTNRMRNPQGIETSEWIDLGGLPRIYLKGEDESARFCFCPWVPDSHCRCAQNLQGELERNLLWCWDQRAPESNSKAAPPR